MVQDPDAEDAAQIVRTLAVHRHCGSKVRVIVELLKPEKAASAIWDDTDQGIEIMCLDVIRFKLLARRCVFICFELCFVEHIPKLFMVPFLPLCRF
jgi:hypothetical protein